MAIERIPARLLFTVTVWIPNERERDEALARAARLEALLAERGISPD